MKLICHQYSKAVHWLSCEELPNLVQSCELPVVVCSDQKLVISGLCSTLRYIVQRAQQDVERSVSHEFASFLKNLLGLRQNCLRACAEVSEWTLYTEVTLPQLVETVLYNSSAIVGSDPPAELVQLENQLTKLPIEPSRHRNQKQHANDTSHAVTKQEYGNGDGIDKLHETKLTKESLHSASLVSDSSEKIMKRFDNLQVVDSVEEICGRRFVEGNNVQLTDLVLFVCIQLLLGSKDIEQWCLYLPRLMSWCQRMAVVPNVGNAVSFVGLFEYCSVARDVAEDSVNSDLSHMSSTKTVTDLKSVEDEMSSGCCHSTSDSVRTKAAVSDQTCVQHTEKTKFRVSQGLVDAAITKSTKMSLQLKLLPLGDGRCLQLPWEQYPSWVLPCGPGGVPDKRAARKLQQLENIAEAVNELVSARSTGSESGIIVDFCSGGGHVGILLAYLFPTYKVC